MQSEGTCVQELVCRWGDMIRDTAGRRRKWSCVERGQVHQHQGAVHSAQLSKGEVKVLVCSTETHKEQTSEVS